jgi:hypothetical protein
MDSFDSSDTLSFSSVFYQPFSSISIFRRGIAWHDSEKRAGGLHLASCPRKRGICFACCTIKTDHISGAVLSYLASNLREALIRSLLSSSGRSAGVEKQKNLSMMYFRRQNESEI